MADETVIIDIQYDTKDAVKAVENLSVSIDANKKKQAELKDQLKKNEISQADYAVKMAETTQTINRQTFERKKYVNVLQAEAGSVKRAKAENQVLREERNKLSTATKEGRKQIEEYNQKIDANSKALIGNVDKQSKMFSTMGELPGVMGKVQGGMAGMTKAAWAFVANPIGAVIAAIAGAAMLLAKSFQRSEGNMNKIRVLAGKVTGVFKGLLKVLEPLATFIADNLIKQFENLGKAVDSTVSFVGKALGKLGFKKASAAIQEYQENIKETSRQAGILAQKQNELTNALRFQEKVMLDFQKLAEKQRQIRDDESKSIDERIKANKELGKILKDQMTEELKTAQMALDVANLRIQVDGETTEALDERAEALTKISDIQERITGQESEQLVNINSLLKERVDNEKAAADAARKAAEEKRKLAEKEAEEAAKEQAEILARRQDAILKLQEIENQRLLSLEEDLTARRDLMIEFEEEEFERLINNELLLNEEKELLRAEHTQNLDEIEAKYREDKVKAEQEVLNATIKNIEDVTAAAGVMLDDRIKMRGEFLSAVVSLNKLEAASEKEKYDIVTGLFSTLTGFITAGQQEEFNQLEQQKAAELELAGNNSEAREGIERKYSKAASDLKRKQFNEDKTKAILDIALNTAVAVVKSLPNIPLSIVVGGIGLASGIAVGTKKFKPETYEQGGKLALFGGNSHANGGTHLYGTDGSHLEVEKGEAAFVLNKEASSEIAALSVINESFGGRAMSGTGRYLEDGGQASQGINPQDLASAMQNVKIVTEVTDIKTGMSKYDKVIKNSVV